jgi:hypothetical protein
LRSPNPPRPRRTRRPRRPSRHARRGTRRQTGAGGHSPGDDFVVSAADGGCTFDVLIHSEFEGIDRVFVDENGSFVRNVFTANGGGTQTLTNLDTGSSLTVHIPGPGFFRVNADGTATMTGTGPWTWFGPLPLSDAPGIFLLRGKFVISFDDQGNVVDYTRQGPEPVDLCAQLA